MFPELIKIPGLNITLNSYGVLVAIGFLAGTLLAVRIAKRDGLDGNKIYDLCIYMLLASLVGSRALLIITEWNYYKNNFNELYSINFLRSGGVFYGGLLASIAASIFLMKRYNLPWWQTADSCAPGIALGQFFGRIGCFAAGCCWGKPTNSWIGVNFTEQAHRLTDVPIDCALHPTQLYEAISVLILCLGLLYLKNYRKFYGQTILIYVFGYSVIRFAIEFFRDDPRGKIFILSTSQFIALVLGVTALFWFMYKYKENNCGSRS